MKRKYKIRTHSVLIFIWALFISLSLVSCKDDELILAENGTTDFEIVFLESGGTQVERAAHILQEHIQKVSGTKIKVVNEYEADSHKNRILLKRFEDTDPAVISIAVKNGNMLLIGGGSSRAVQDAVYVFLEKYLGIDWYAPGVARIPALKTVKIPKNTNYRYKPGITTRTVHSRLFYEHPGFAEKLRVTDKAFPGYVPAAKVHTFRKFIPEAQFFKAHPEYFAYRNGKRIPTQLCLTNKAVLRIVKDSVRSLFKRFPDAEVLSVSQNDNQQYCMCDRCQKIDQEEGSPSGTMIRFVNQVARDFPDKEISTLAYQYTRKPCKTKPADNVLITLCSIECDRSSPITEKCTAFADDLRGWKELTGNIRIWDYTTQFTNFLAPFPNIRTLQPNIRFFRDSHAKWVFEQHSNNPSELFELRSYLMAKLLWNPDLNKDSLLTEFTNGYYRAAGKYVRQYIDLIHNELEKYPKERLYLYGDPSQAFDSYLRPDLLRRYDSLFNRAEAAVKSHPELLKRVRTARLGIDFAILEACRKNLSKTFKLTQAGPEGTRVANPEVVKRLEAFQNACKAANITMMNEMRFSVSEYVSDYKHVLKKASVNNKAYRKKVVLLTKSRKYANEDPQVLTDGAFGGNSFFANWLGFEGNDMVAVIDLGKETEIHSITTGFLQVTNHIVFFPEDVRYFVSNDGKRFVKLGTVKNKEPLNPESKVNTIQDFRLDFRKQKARFIKIKATNLKKAPFWHPASGLPAWIFADEVIIE